MSTFSACSPKGGDDGRINIVVTIFPIYDWFRQIIGDDHLHKFNLVFLIDKGIDLHNYSPTISDIAAVRDADIFVHVGGHSDGWVRNALRNGKAGRKTAHLLEILGSGNLIIGDEFICDECGESHNPYDNADEHVWLSLGRAVIICAAIADLLAKADPENAHVYYENLETYAALLIGLDNEYRDIVNEARLDTLLFADRFPFRYTAYDYGLEYHAVFQGCFAESEASFATVLDFAERLNRTGIGVVMVTECSDQSIARSIINNTRGRDQRILVLNAMQSVSAAEARGATYYGIMRNNLEVLSEALR